MKIAHIVNSLNTGGAEKLILDSLPIYKQKGLEVDLILLDDKPTAFRREFEQNNTIKVLGLTKSSIYNPLLIFKLIPLLKRYPVIHGHLFPVLYWIVLAKIIARIDVRIIFTEHSTNNKRRSHPILKYIDRYIYSKVDFIGCISEGTKEELDKHIKMPYKTKVIHNGVDLHQYSTKQNSLKDPIEDIENKITLIQIASFRYPKDQATVIKAIGLLPSKYNLLLVGDGPLRGECEELVSSLQLNDRVLFLGNRYDIPQLLFDSSIVIVSSKYEGFALVAVEGMAMGKPVVASNVTGVRDIVEGAGLLFEVGNSKDLVDKVQSLIADTHFFNETSEKCLIRSRAYSIERMVDHYMDLYK
ncbi:glycosyltransferase [Sphingobacterium sp. UBA5670]|uniref:glycosyltransferase n=1 Tax=Sphingobacterium sp. UBA5670 TaxID=1947502 RepID=UPI0025D90A50|nr:glycosyltransferase [Sphingobacterium sp. UBA5670]